MMNLYITFIGFMDIYISKLRLFYLNFNTSTINQWLFSQMFLKIIGSIRQIEKYLDFHKIHT